jgi:hypothetical protein
MAVVLRSTAGREKVLSLFSGFRWGDVAEIHHFSVANPLLNQ